jgi:hypothetical protein
MPADVVLLLPLPLSTPLVRLGLVRVSCLDSLAFTVCTLIFYVPPFDFRIYSQWPSPFSFSFSLKFCRVPVVTESRSLY